jgi:acyl carrier protein
MGLDSVEFLIAIEDAFGIFIPEADAVSLATPGILVDYLENRLTKGSAGCLEQRAFYRLRKGGVQVLNCPRNSIRPATSWHDLLDERHGARQWALIGKVSGLSPWPKYRPLFGRGAVTQSLSDTARAVAATSPQSLMYDDEGWSRASIEVTVRHIMAEELGIEDFQLTDRFAQDLGVD